MKSRPALALLTSIALAPASSLAQFTSDSTVTYSLTWDDVGGGGLLNHNGEINLGESVLFRLSVSFSNQNGTANFSPPVGSYSSGIIRGFAGTIIDIGTTSPYGNGTWDVSHAHGYGVASPWRITGNFGDGTPNANGSQINAVQPGQFPMVPADIITTDPIVNIYSALWTPQNFGFVEFISFSVLADPAGGANPSSVLLDLGDNLVYGPTCPSVFGFTNVRFDIPGPSGLALLCLAAIARRRR